MAIKSDILPAVTPAVTIDEPTAGLVDDEQELLAEIDRLRGEVDRLTDQLREERLDRGAQLELQTVLSSLTNPPPGLDPAGRRLPDGRFIPMAVADGGTSAPVEPGAPRVAPGVDAAESSCEFAPDDESATAFDEFFNAPDAQLDKIRRFLLD